MTSGRPLTDLEIYAIQRLASYKDADGHWLYSVAQIAQRVRHDERTVGHYIREGNAGWHKLTRWRRADPD